MFCLQILILYIKILIVFRIINWLGHSKLYFIIIFQVPGHIFYILYYYYILCQVFSIIVLTEDKLHY